VEADRVRVLVVVAHPDDELLGVGGTILRHIAAGDEVHVHIDCIRGLRAMPERTSTAQTIARDTGHGLTFGVSEQLADRDVLHDVAALRASWDIVYTHHPGDLNRAHRAVSEAVQVACRPHTSDILSMRYFETPSSTEWGSGFAPNLFVDIEAHLGEKLDYLARYETEMRPWPHPRSQEALIARARYWGQVSGFRAAEAIVVARERW
jgi:LmbE family N-acetylglucosaminyl deacetylase